jgi:hypothetical protein
MSLMQTTFDKVNVLQLTGRLVEEAFLIRVNTLVFTIPLYVCNLLLDNNLFAGSNSNRLRITSESKLLFIFSPVVPLNL